jgi:hypothetical protein
MMNKLAMINSCEIQVCTILVCALYSIKYGNTIGTNGSYLELIIFIWYPIIAVFQKIKIRLLNKLMRSKLNKFEPVINYFILI